jgi:hypothetical protein
VTASGGVAAFDNLIIDAAGGYTLQVTDGSLTAATSAPFNINADQADHLVFVQQPSDTTAGQVISPAVTVEVVDQFGNLVTSDNSTVSIAVATGPGTFSNGSTLTVTARGGIANFNNLVLDIAGSYTLQATDGWLTAAVSDPFNITPP